jgi:hypothetical protein
MPKNKRNTDSFLKEEDYSDALIDGKFYQGNENILRKSATFKWTDEMIEELKLCTKSILHFAENYFYITTLDEGKKKIELYKYQKRLLKSFKNNRFNVVLSSRQSGKTTTITIYALWMVSFLADKKVTIVANKESTAKEIFARIKMAYEQLPIFLKPNVKSWRKDGFLLGNDSAITISTTSSAGPRGSSSNLLIIDEMAHCQKDLMDELWKSAIPIISSSKKSQIIVISTPNGTNNKFYELYQSAQQIDNEWHLETVGWQEVPGRDENWKKSAIDMLGGSIDDFEQEFNNTFIEPGKSVVDLSYLEELKQQSSEPLLVNEDGKYNIFHLPEPGHFYVIGVDVGEGIGRSNSVAQILDVTDLQSINQVAVYAANDITPFHFGSKLMSIVDDWGRPPILIEANNNGQQVLDVICQTHNYENVVTYHSEGVSKHYNNSNRFGIYNHTNTRYKGIANFRYWMNGLKAVKLNDLNTILEIYNFVRLPNYTYSKRSDKDKDDRVFALIWALFILDPNLVTKHFIIQDLDTQGRPMKLLPTFDNSDLIKQSPLLIGGKSFLKPRSNPYSAINYIGVSNQESVFGLEEEKQNLLNWLLQSSSIKTPESVKDEDKSIIEEKRPIVLF